MTAGKDRHVVCSREALPVGAVHLETIDGREIGVINVDGEPFAMLNRCPHALAPMCKGAVTGTLLPSEVGEFTYGMENEIIRCPWHQFQFDLRTGEPLAKRGGKLRVYDAAFEGDDVVVYL